MASNLPPLGPAAAAPFVENVLHGFNGTVDLRVAYTWNRVQILRFLESVVATPGWFNVAGAIVPELTDILKEIKNLIGPNSLWYNSPAPAQPISRSLNPEWDDAHPSRRKSKFRLRYLNHDGVRYWSPLDLLGLFIAKIGPAPVGATKRNFFLPMTAVYAKWSGQLVQQGPFMYNCTWKTDPNGDQFFLGASLLRGTFRPEDTGTWGSVVKKARYHLVDGEPLTLAGWSFSKCPQSEVNQRRTPFGNCAETYPFVYFMQGHGGTNVNVHGISLPYKGVRPAAYDDRLSGQTWRRVADPCLNCQELIRIHGGTLSNFFRYQGSAGAPP